MVSVTPYTFRHFMYTIESHHILWVRRTTISSREYWRPPPTSETTWYPHIASNRRQPGRNTGGGLPQRHSHPACGSNKSMHVHLYATDMHALVATGTTAIEGIIIFEWICLFVRYRLLLCCKQPTWMPILLLATYTHHYRFLWWFAEKRSITWSCLSLHRHPSSQAKGSLIPSLPTPQIFIAYSTRLGQRGVTSKLVYIKGVEWPPQPPWLRAWFKMHLLYCLWQSQCRP